MKYNKKTSKHKIVGTLSIVLGIMLLANFIPAYVQAAPTPRSTYSSDNSDTPSGSSQTPTTTKPVFNRSTRQPEHRNISRNDVYKTIGGLIREQQQNPQQTAATAPLKVEVKQPVKQVKVQSMTQKKGIMYQAMEKIIPHDPYVDSGFNPITTDILYGLSGLVGIAGALLVTGKPAFIATKIASLFTFA